MPRATGPDVSHHRPISDWGALLDHGIAFLGVKATQGRTFVSPWLDRHRDGARAAGDRLAAVVYYHFAAKGGGPAEQAAHLLARLGPLRANERLALDVEGPDAESLSWLSPDWIASFFAALPTDRRHLLYTSERVWRLLGAPAYPGAADIDLWLPRYSTEEPKVPKPWRDIGRTWTFWQHSESAVVPGIDQPCDLNYFNGDEESLRRWATLKGDPVAASDGSLPRSPFA